MSEKTSGYIVISDMGTMRLSRAEKQIPRYGMVLFWGARATVFRTRAKARAALDRTIAYRHEMYGSRPERDSKKYWIMELGATFDGELPKVPPAPKKRRSAHPQPEG